MRLKSSPDCSVVLRRSVGAEARRILTSACAALLALAVAPPAAASSDIISAADGSKRVERNVFVTMRDGARLATDVHLPERGAGQRVPVILIRTPYSKSAKLSVVPFLTENGYAVALQDKRGRFNSDGLYIPSAGDAEDGYDTVDWLSRQPWSNGRVGAYGCSYSGDVQIFMAGLKHPALKAIIPQASGSAVGSLGGHYRYFGSRVGGAVELIQSIGWFAENGQKATPRLPTTLPRDFYNEQAKLWAHVRRKENQIDNAQASKHLPVADALSAQGLAGTDYRDTISRGLTDPYWADLPYMTDAFQSDVPALFINSWYDFGADMTMAQFRHFREKSVSAEARKNQFAIMSPHTHCEFEREAKAQTKVGERELGDTRFDYRGTYLTWFDAWLKQDAGARRTMESWPPLRYYAMGRNRWQAASDWPLPEARATPFYLESDSGANTLHGDGRLARQHPFATGSDRFTYDPADPVPSRGGSMCCTGTPAAVAGALDQRVVQNREDVLVYTSEPLRSDLEVTGDPAVVLYVSSDAVDTDFTVKLSDVYPDGRSFNVLESILRARFRDGKDREVWMEPGRIYPIRIPMGATSNVFLKDHRIRLEVSSSNFPRFDRNLNVGGDNALESRWVVAHNAIHHGPKHRSRLLLPVVDNRRPASARTASTARPAALHQPR